MCYSLEIDSAGLEEKIQSYIQDYSYKIARVSREDIWGHSTDGGELIVSRDENDNLLQFELTLCYEMGKVQYKCFYISEGLLYILEIVKEYNIPYYMQFQTIENLEMEEFRVIEHKKSEYILENKNAFIRDSDMSSFHKLEDLDDLKGLNEILKHTGISIID